MKSVIFIVCTIFGMVFGNIVAAYFSGSIPEWNNVFIASIWVIYTVAMMKYLKV